MLTPRRVALAAALALAEGFFALALEPGWEVDVSIGL